ncbi:MAG: HAD family hydrolase [Bacteroidota bacterium]
MLAGAISPEADRRERFRRMLDGCGVEMQAAEIEGAVDCYRRAYEAHRRAAPGVAALIGHLRARGARIGVVTNGLRAVQEEKLQVCRLDRLVDFLLGGSRGEEARPAPLHDGASKRRGMSRGRGGDRGFVGV